MKPTAGDDHNDIGTEWSRVLKIASRGEFEQSFAVAKLAINLCELEMSKRQTSLQKENLDPERFLDEAWQLIGKARQHVLRAQTDEEYLVAHGGSDEAVENVVRRKLGASCVSFQQLCDPKRNKGDTEVVKLLDAGTREAIEVEWRVFTTERAFEDLFSAWWQERRAVWKDSELAKIELDDKSYDEHAMMAKLVNDPVEWEACGKAVLYLWKRDGVPRIDFLALVRFRKERDNRIENLQKKPDGSVDND